MVVLGVEIEILVVVKAGDASLTGGVDSGIHGYFLSVPCRILAKGSGVHYAKDPFCNVDFATWPHHAQTVDLPLRARR